MIDVVVGYKNVDDLFRRMRESGGVFLKTDQVLDLPEQIHTRIECKRTKDYENLKKNRICTTETPAGEIELVGDSVMALMIGLRKLAGAYNPSKSQALDDLIESTDGRMVVFYNFNAELNVIINAATKANRPIAVINGEHHDTKLYEDIDNCILAVQYQAGSMGLNLQQGHVIVYFAPTHSFDQFDQSKKRIHRIGQTQTCMYYYLVADGTIEVNIYKTLEKREDYTLKLFEDDLEK
jgi:SNF2 family DNA or RNA helicase